MPTVDVVLPKPHVKQREFEQNTRRFNILNCGRRFGKDVELQRRIVRKALTTRKPVAWFAPTYKMLLENWRDLRTILAPVTARVSDSERRIDLVTGNPVEMWSLDNPDAPRGRKYAYIAVNEAAMVKDLAYTWATVLRPTLADYRGEADFGSTPRGLNGFYTLWAQAGSDPDWARFHYKTEDNPHIPRDEVAAMRKLPERVVKQELDAEFVEDGAYFQGANKIAVLKEPDRPEQHPGHTFLMAADWGKANDWSVFGVGCQECHKVVDWERFNKIDYIYQRERLYSFYRRWNPVGILPERNSMGEPNVEMLMNEGLPILDGPDGKPGFMTTPASKPPLIEGLAQAFIMHNFLVPLEAFDELSIFEVNITANNHYQYGAPDGKHDDWVMMLALLWRAMSTVRPLIAFTV